MKKQEKIKEVFSQMGIEVYFISAFTGEGVQEVLKKLAEIVEGIYRIVKYS